MVAPDGKPIAAGEEGLLKVRGCSNFVGYLRRPQLYNHDAEGWFDTGDLARADSDGYIRITGRAITGMFSPPRMMMSFRN